MGATGPTGPTGPEGPAGPQGTPGADATFTAAAEVPTISDPGAAGAPAIADTVNQIITSLQAAGLMQS